MLWLLNMEDDDDQLKGGHNRRYAIDQHVLKMMRPWWPIRHKEDSGYGGDSSCVREMSKLTPRLCLDGTTFDNAGIPWWGIAVLVAALGMVKVVVAISGNEWMNMLCRARYWAWGRLILEVMIACSIPCSEIIMRGQGWSMACSNDITNLKGMYFWA